MRTCEMNNVIGIYLFIKFESEISSDCLKVSASNMTGLSYAHGVVLVHTLLTELYTAGCGVRERELGKIDRSSGNT